MELSKLKDAKGLTLLELTVAMAIFAVIMSCAAQGLVSFYAVLALKQQRYEATQNCQKVISAIRQARDTGTGDFPDAIVEQWPVDGAVADAGTLLEETVVVSYEDATANPLMLTVTSNWSDLRGRQARTSVTTLLTDS